MRWSSAYTTAVLTGALCFSCEFTQAFSPTTPLLQHNAAPTTERSMVGGIGWDNEDFLDGLGNGEDAQGDANDKYYRHARMGRPEEPGADDINESNTNSNEDEGFTTGASLTKDMIEKVKASHTPEEEASGGGKMFRELKRRAEEAAAQGTFKRPPPELAAPPPPVPPPPAAGGVPDPNQLTVEQQAALFRQMMQGGGAAATPAVPPVPPQSFAPEAAARQPVGNPVAPDGRRIGRNRDADAIVNSADVYFAQLKRDSAVRNGARFSGDLGTANAVFEDPSLKDIELHVNPYLEEAKKKEQALLETSMDEMVLPGMLEPKEEKPKSYAGISFKERLAAKRRGEQPPTAAAPPPAAAAAPPPVEPVAPPPPAAAAPPPPAAVEPVAPPPPPVVETPPTPVVDPTPVAETQPPPVEAEMVSQSSAPSPPPPPVAVQSTESASRPEAGSDAMRTELRTLMGLLMKHKGGPGFGVGRIIGAERQRFEGLARSVPATLREEAMMYPDTELDGEGIDLQVQSAPPAIQQQQQQQVAPEAPPTPAAPPSGASVDGMIACIQGAVQMYQNSPPELHESVIGTLRAALLAAVKTCNDLIGEDGPAAPTAAATAANTNTEGGIEPMIACIQGAVQMYQHSPPEVQPSVLVTLRAALLSAVATCNAVIANYEVGNVQAYQQQQQQQQEAPPPQMSAPVAEAAAAQVVEPVAAPEAAAPAEQPPAPTYNGDDPNTGFLIDVYDKLSNAAGDGNLGLRKDLTAEEASALADDVADARLLLVDELDNGIPKAASAEEATSTASKYQELLARARASK